MSTDNPFDAPDSVEDSGARDFGDREPAPLDIGGVLGRCWELVTEQPGTIILTLLILFGVSILFAVPDGVLEFLQMEQTREEDMLPYIGARLVLQLVGGLVSLFFSLGAVRVFAEIAGGNEGRVSMVVSEAASYLSALGAYIILIFVLLIGFLLFIVPGIVLAIGLQFVLYVIVHERLGPIDALARSWELTDGYKLDLFVINLVISLGAVAVICGTCGVGALVVWPVLSMVQAVMYHSLLHHNAQAEFLRNEG